MFPDPIVRPSTDSTGTTSAPVPQTKTSRAVHTSNRLNGRSKEKVLGRYPELSL